MWWSNIRFLHNLLKSQIIKLLRNYILYYFLKKNFFNRKKWLMKIKNATYFAVFANFVTHENPPRYMVNGYLFLLFGIHGCFGIMFLLKFHPRPLHGLQSSLGRVRIYGSMSTSAFILLTNTHIIYMYYSFGFIY